MFTTTSASDVARQTDNAMLILVLVCLVLMGFAKVDYRVRADAVLEGRVQRAIVA